MVIILFLFCSWQLSIIEYLDETRPDPPLLPKDDPHKRALVFPFFHFFIHFFILTSAD